MDDGRMRELYADHATAVRNFLMKAGQSRDDADDIIQQTMVRAWQNIGSLDEDRVRPWLFTVAKRIMVDEHRKRLVRPVTVSREWRGDGDPWGGVTDGGIGRVIDRTTVDEALAAMTPRRRRVFELRYLHGLNTPEIADRLGIPAGTVKSGEYYGAREARRAVARG